MQRWQYRVVNLGGYDAGPRLVVALGHLGERGWELVAVYDKSSNWLAGMEKGFAVFKRPVPDGDAPDGAWADVVKPEIDPASIPAAWYPDPLERHEQRLWDGTTWTDQVRDGEQTSIDPLSSDAD